MLFYSKNYPRSISPHIIKWIQCYLSCQEQYVVVNGTQSLTLPVMSGVPQRSVLGPLLFLIYIIDITCAISNGKISVYANVIVLYHSPMDYILVQEDVDSICAWVDQNLLLLNTLKCCYLLFSRKSTPTLPPSPLFVNDELFHHCCHCLHWYHHWYQSSGKATARVFRCSRNCFCKFIPAISNCSNFTLLVVCSNGIHSITVCCVYSCHLGPHSP